MPSTAEVLVLSVTLQEHRGSVSGEKQITAALFLSLLPQIFQQESDNALILRTPLQLAKQCVFLRLQLVSAHVWCIYGILGISYTLRISCVPYLLLACSVSLFECSKRLLSVDQGVSQVMLSSCGTL